MASSSSSLTGFALPMHSRMANLAARLQISAMSAPVKPSVAVARLCTCTSSDLGDFRSTASKILARESKSGIGMWIIWSRRPGRVTAGSRMSGLFVAPMMKTFFLLSIPSISVRIWLITRSPAPPASPPPPPRDLAIESSSSKNSTQGAACLALSKTSRTFASDSPNHMVSSSGPLTEMKLAPQQLATALAMSVLPHPGGP
mmetsp:Transcript_3130/g.10938  ORF Transcript_3130/g.10938 Transcript_3130/m.10938 type:complete len:201 (-) Transcript_3130:1479-2081(-)